MPGCYHNVEPLGTKHNAEPLSQAKHNQIFPPFLVKDRKRLCDTSSHLDVTLGRTDQFTTRIVHIPAQPALDQASQRNDKEFAQMSICCSCIEFVAISDFDSVLNL